jgi:hypothetical protein
VWGSSASDIHAVGAEGTILHWDGRTWTPQAGGTEADLVGVWGAGPTEAYAAAEDGTILRWDGVRWTLLPGTALRDFDHRRPTE